MSRPPYSSSSNSTFSAATIAGLLHDDYEDDMDCPLCLEELDISDLNFKPCPCGYQICRFCWHHIKENLNGLCPACRAAYDDDRVEFKAIKPDELKRLEAAKKIRDKRRKDDALTMKNMANVRVRQRAQVHVQGMTTKIANEDTLNQLKAVEHFGQYGKVVKLFMSKRSSTVTQPMSTHPLYQPVNVYVNYRTASEAAVCIAAIDGTTTEDGHKLKAIWGTTRYCPTYLKGGNCNNENCMQAHEPGEEIEGLAGPTSREEMLTYHAMSDVETQRSKASNAITQIRKQQEAATLPAAASWASKNAPPTAPIIIDSSLPPLSASIRPPHVHPPPPARPISVSRPVTHPLPARPTARKSAAEMRKESRTNSTTFVVPMPASTATPSRSPEMTHRMPPGLDVSRQGSPIVHEGDFDSLHPIASSSNSPSRAPSPSAFSEFSSDPFNTFPSPRAAIEDPIYRPPSVPFPELNFGFGLDESFDFSLHLDVKGKRRAVENSAINGNGMNGDARFDAFGYGVEGNDFVPYAGSFDPFADHKNHSSAGSPSSFDRMGLSNDNRGADSDGMRSGSSSPPPSGDDSASRRSSRFGFARRGSHGISGVGMSISGSGGVKSNDLGSAFARSAFTSPGPGSGRESPITSFAPPGLHHPHLQSQRSSVSYPSDGGRPVNGSNGMGNIDPATLWPGINLAPTVGYSTSPIPAALLRSLAGNGSNSTTTTNTSSPQLSPRTRATSYVYNASQSSPTPSSSAIPVPSIASSSLPPGISLNRPPMASLPLPMQMPMSMPTSIMGMSPSSYPLPAASFPLPPAVPRSSTGGSGKNDLLAMIAAAQANNKAKNAVLGANGLNLSSHPFSDPAILNARLASASPLPPLPPSSSGPAPTTSSSAAYHSLIEGMTSSRNMGSNGNGTGGNYEQQQQQRQQLVNQQQQQQMMMMQQQQQQQQYNQQFQMYR